MHTKRGRPRINRPMHDTGTPELVLKRAAGITAETLDACLARGIITANQHWSGIHFRWLHTLRFGAPGVRAVDTTAVSGIDIKPDDPHWRAAREAEYQHALRLLGPRLSAAAIRYCIYNERLAAMSAPAAHSAEYASLGEALDILANLWCNKEKIKKIRATLPSPQT